MELVGLKMSRCKVIDLAEIILNGYNESNWVHIGNLAHVKISHNKIVVISRCKSIYIPLSSTEFEMFIESLVCIEKEGKYNHRPDTPMYHTLISHGRQADFVEIMSYKKEFGMYQIWLRRSIRQSTKMNDFVELDICFNVASKEMPALISKMSELLHILEAINRNQI